MPSTSPAIAKLTRPRLGRPILRERLFEVLDEARLRGASVFVTAPPGAGKTALVASWLEARRIRSIWYQADRADSDPATFFHYLGQAARTFARTGGAELPVLTTGHLGDVEAFARRFFRELFSRMGRGTALAIDNCQELTGRWQLQTVIAQAVEEAPAGVTVLPISRESPPEDCARLIANERMVLIDWRQLGLTLQEARQIAHARNPAISGAIIDRLHFLSSGWAAGFTLLLENLACARDAGPHRPDAPDILFDYFTAEVFKRAPAAAQRLLLLTAQLPWVDVDIAREITRDPEAEAILADLHRRNLFVDRILRSRPAYQYHPLFRQFLLRKSESALESAARRTLTIKAARLLREREEWEPAVQLFIEAGAWEEAAESILVNARSLLSQGRWQTLTEWIGRIPREQLDGRPWLRYWLGVSRAAVDAVSGRSELERAFELFRDRHEALGEMLSAAEILRAYFLEFRSFERVDEWIDTLIALVSADHGFPNEESELRVFSALLSALVSRRPAHPLLDRCVERANRLLKGATDPNLIVAAGISVCFYATLCGRIDLAEATATAVQPRLRARELSPVLQVFWLGSYGYLRYVAGDNAEAIRLFDEAERVALANGLGHRIRFVRAWRAYCARRIGDVRTAGALASELERSATHASSRTDALWLRALNERSKGRIGHAVELGEKALSNQAGDCILHGSQQLQLAEMMVEAERIRDGERWLGRARSLVAGTFSEKAWSPVLLLIEALIALREGDVRRCETRLGEALAEIRRCERLVFIRWFPYTLSELLPVALESGIEPESTCRLIDELGIAPGDRKIDKWPWPVSIRTLGRYEIRVKGQPVRYSRKTPRKALALLGAIIASGGRDVPEDALVDALWPDAEGDVGHRLLKATLHRLRNLLAVRDVVIQKGGTLSLDFGRCWVDALTFQELAGKADPAVLDAAVDLYKGPFLVQEGDAPWVLPFRSRLKALFASAILTRASKVEAEGRAESALHLYQKGLEADRTVEAFQQGLTRCYQRLGQPSTTPETRLRPARASSLQPGV